MTDMEKKVKRWADRNDWDEDDLAIIAGALQAGQLSLQIFANDRISYDTRNAIDDVYEALYQQSSLHTENGEDDDYPDPLHSTIQHLALSSAPPEPDTED